MPRKGENIRKRSDGRWEGRYCTIDCTTGKKQYHSVYARTYRNVKEKLITIKHEQMEAPPVFSGVSDETTESFGYIAGMWLQNVRENCKYSTYVKYRQTYEKHIKDAAGEMKIALITPETIKDIIKVREISSESLIRSIYCVVNQVIVYAQNNRIAVTATIKRDRAVKTARPVEVMKYAEQVRLFEILYSDMDRYKFGILLCLSTGLRLGEICALKWSDIDVNGQLLYVNRTVQRITVEDGSSKTKLLESEPKSIFSKRLIPLSDEMTRLAQEFHTDGEYVVSKNRPTEPRTYQNRFRRLLCQADIPEYNFHTLRHTFATNCMDSGADIKSLSEMLGHSSVNITLNRYVHPSVQTKRQHLNTLSAIYGQYLGQQPS
ncbi:MAG: site-specific integrase [Acetatifactor sp.]|nr:site-specific integrase [Acetatifactor sp.]